jgi:hypothetical protein
MAKFDFEMRELVQMQEKLRKNKVREDRERRTRERSTLDGLWKSAEDRGVAGLLDTAHQNFTPTFTSAVPLGGSLAFMGKVGSKERSILRILLSKSDDEKGLCFEVHLDRLFDHLGETNLEGRRSLVSSFPLGSDEGSRPATDWSQGFFSSKAQIVRSGKAMMEHGFEREMRQQRDHLAASWGDRLLGFLGRGL